MILTILILLPVIGGFLAWLASYRSSALCRWIALITMIVHLVIVAVLWGTLPNHPGWLIEVNVPWITTLGISYHLGLDGISLLLVLLTSFLGVISVAASWFGIQERLGLFHFMLLWIIAAITGVFLALDLFLFYFFWEMTLVPLYFLIAVWGHENRTYAAIKFFIFTQASSLLMLIAILGLYFINEANTGTYTFDYNVLIHANLAPVVAFWLCLGFLIAFIVKLPAFPFHTWLPDAHTEAPTAGSVVLAGLVLKLGAYGLLRFIVPLFPGPSHILAPWMMALGVIGILYGALEAYGQRDFKRLVAYTSVSHMGFVLIGIFAWNTYALTGAVMVMLAHGISTGALFVVAGDLQDRLHTRDMQKMGGLWEVIPRHGGVSLLFALASLGLPGLANFVGEFLVLLGAYQANITMAVLATLGFIGSTIYSLWLVQRAFQGPNTHQWKLPAMSLSEGLLYASLILAVLWMGIYPRPFINTALPALQTMQQYAGRAQAENPVSPPGEVVVVQQPGEKP